MGKVIASASMSLDGFVANPSDQVGPNGGQIVFLAVLDEELDRVGVGLDGPRALFSCSSVRRKLRSGT